MESILKQIDEKKKEIETLKKQLNEKAKEKYKYLEGKYFSLAATCMIFIKEIISFDEQYRCINVECIRIQGGKHNGGFIDVNPHDDYNLYLKDINKSIITEISRERFLSFLDEALSCAKDRIIAIL